MKPLFSLFTALIAGLVLTFVSINVAEAKRLGSGSSFGGKLNHSQPVKKNAANNGGQQLTPAQQTNMERKQQLASRGGLMGILGGLALGGILGALFFGGAFENLNFFDILIFGLIAFLLFRLFVARSRQRQSATVPAYSRENAGESQYRQHRDNLASDSADEISDAVVGVSTAGDSLDSLRGSIPKHFDSKDFLQGAKNCFERLQRAWDEGDLADIRQFTTDHVFSEIQDQYRAREGQTNTEVLNLNAELLNVTELAAKTEATVLFEADMHEEGVPVRVTEIWHFSRSANSHHPSWRLNGIQQVEE